jgi:hypothetical protein
MISVPMDMIDAVFMNGFLNKIFHFYFCEFRIAATRRAYTFVSLVYFWFNPFEKNLISSPILNPIF